MAKDDGAFLTIGELAQELGIAQHILRYWETRFPQLRPLQRSGNRRYYRPRDVDVARQINRLLNEEGFTVRGAQRMLSSRKDTNANGESPPAPLPAAVEAMAIAPEPEMVQDAAPLGDLFSPAAAPPERQEVAPSDLALLIARLTVIRQNLVDALESD